jgi:hypothetical protein
MVRKSLKGDENKSSEIIKKKEKNVEDQTKKIN